MRKILVLGALLLSGCATIVTGSTQSVSVSTGQEIGAQCTLSNSEGVWYLTSPGSTTVHKTKNDLTVHCAKPGFRDGTVTVSPNFQTATAGNIFGGLAGVVIGGGVDAFSGANYFYESPIIVDIGR